MRTHTRDNAARLEAQIRFRHVHGRAMPVLMGEPSPSLRRMLALAKRGRVHDLREAVEALGEEAELARAKFLKVGERKDYPPEKLRRLAAQARRLDRLRDLGRDLLK